MNVDFGYKHLSGLAWLGVLIIILLTVLLLIKKRWRLGDGFDKGVIRYTCYFMWALEIIKTVRLINYPDYGPVGHYPIWMAPFHICSMALYVFLIVGSKRAGRLAKFVTPFAYSVIMVVTSIILTIPASSGILGPVEDWSLCFDNILPYQSWLYHGSILFVPLYMALSGFYRPKWLDILKSICVLAILAAFSQSLNFIFDGSGADFMTLRYGNGNPFAFLLADSPALYYIVLAAVSTIGVTFVITVTICVRWLGGKLKKNAVASAV